MTKLNSWPAVMAICMLVIAFETDAAAQTTPKCKFSPPKTESQEFYCLGYEDGYRARSITMQNGAPRVIFGQSITGSQSPFDPKSLGSIFVSSTWKTKLASGAADWALVASAEDRSGIQLIVPGDPSAPVDVDWAVVDAQTIGEWAKNPKLANDLKVQIQDMLKDVPASETGYQLLIPGLSDIQ